MGKSRKNRGTQFRVQGSKTITVTYGYSSDYGGWVAPWGLTGGAVLGMCDGETLQEVFDSIVGEIRGSIYRNYIVYHTVDSVNTDTGKQCEAATFLAVVSA